MRQQRCSTCASRRASTLNPRKGYAHNSRVAPEARLQTPPKHSPPDVPMQERAISRNVASDQSVGPIDTHAAAPYYTQARAQACAPNFPHACRARPVREGLRALLQLRGPAAATTLAPGPCVLTVFGHPSTGLGVRCPGSRDHLRQF